MDQLALFRPPDMLLGELHLSLSRIELKTAHGCLVEYENAWGDVGLTWEPPFLDFWTVSGPPGDLDGGWSRWLRLQRTDFWPKVPLSIRLGFRTNYFQMILGLAEDHGETRTSNGISKGYLHFLAGRLDSSLALLQREVMERVDDPLPHLYLGNAQYLLNDTWAARANYRDALLKALKEDDYAEILDIDIRTFLAEVEASEWAVIEGCILAVLPVAHLRSADSVARFLEKHPWLRNTGSCPLPSPIRQFYACLVISESRAMVDEDMLMKARLHMKFLNGRAHRLHMDRLDQKA